jgi:26S proteasome non-ATPase regulatory subunit 9
MGFTLPSLTNPMEQARALITRKEDIEAEIEAQISILKTNSSTLQSPLVDEDGFPRADIDIYAVRGARVRIIELRNDLAAVTNAIANALEGIYGPSLQGAEASETRTVEGDPKPFGKLNGVAPGSPAAEAVRMLEYLTLSLLDWEPQGLQREDLILKFGHLDHRSFSSTSLQPLADLVASSENVSSSPFFFCLL